MTDYISKTNAELSRVVAERCGHKHQGEWECLACGFVQVLRILSAIDGSVGVDEDQGRRVCPNDGKTLIPWVPPYAESMDACLVPGGPVEYLRDRGLTLVTYSWPSYGHTVQVLNEQMLRREAAFIEGETSLPRALCLAFLAATEGDHA